MKFPLKKEWVEIGLRLSLGGVFLSAVADRLGLWPKDVSVWYTWESFIEYTAVLNPWFPLIIMPIIGGIVTGLEILFGIALLFNYKTNLMSKLSGVLLLLFALAMCLTTGVKSMLDYGVLPLSFSAFAFGYLKV